MEETLRLGELRGLERGELTIVIGKGFVRELMSKVMVASCARYPGVNVQMQTVGAEDAVAHMVEDRAHLGWTLCPPAHPAVRIMHERPQPLCAIMARRIFWRGRLPGCRAVAQYPLALAPAGTGLRALTRQAEVAEGIRFNAIFLANSIDALIKIPIATLVAGSTASAPNAWSAVTLYGLIDAGLISALCAGRISRVATTRYTSL